MTFRTEEDSGRSTVELVQDMYDGVKAMIEKEKSL